MRSEQSPPRRSEKVNTSQIRGRQIPWKMAVRRRLSPGDSVMQVLSAKRKPDAPGGGLSLKIRAEPWESKLVQIWPVEKPRVNWPPPQSFSDLDDGLRDLRRRFAVGVSSSDWSMRRCAVGFAGGDERTTCSSETPDEFLVSLISFLPSRLSIHGSLRSGRESSVRCIASQTGSTLRLSLIEPR